MSRNRLVIDGLDELREALRTLPAELTGEAGHRVEAAANRAALTVKQGYGQHRVTGHLQDAVTVTEDSSSQFGVAYTVAVRDPIAWLFDNGSQARHWIGGKSTGVMWGKTPPTHLFAGTMARARRTLWSGPLRDLLTRHGLVVS